MIRVFSRDFGGCLETHLGHRSRAGIYLLWQCCYSFQALTRHTYSYFYHTLGKGKHFTFHSTAFFGQIIVYLFAFTEAFKTFSKIDQHGEQEITAQLLTKRWLQ